MSYIFPSDQDRGDDELLNEACERIEELMDQLASRHALEGKAVGIVRHSTDPRSDNPSAHIDWQFGGDVENLTHGTKLYTHPYSADEPEGYVLVEKGITPEHVIVAGERCLEMMSQDHAIGLRVQVAAVFQDMLLAAGEGQTVSTKVPEAWRTTMKELADDLESEIEARRSGDLGRRIVRDLLVVDEARVLLDEQEKNNGRDH